MLKLGMNARWTTPFLRQAWNEFDRHQAGLVNLVHRLEASHQDHTEVVPIAGLTRGLATQWYAYNLLDQDDRHAQALRRFVFKAVRRYMRQIGHEESKLLYQCWANLLRDGEALRPHSHVGPYSYISGVFFVRTPHTSTRYLLPLDRRIPGVDDFYDAEVAIENEEGELVIFPSFIEHLSTPAPEGAERITVAFDILRRPPPNVLLNGFGYEVLSEFPQNRTISARS